MIIQIEVYQRLKIPFNRQSFQLQSFTRAKQNYGGPIISSRSMLYHFLVCLKIKWTLDELFFFFGFDFSDESNDSSWERTYLCINSLAGIEVYLLLEGKLRRNYVGRKSGFSVIYELEMVKSQEKFKCESAEIRG